MAGLFTESKHPRGRDGKFVDVIGRMQGMGATWDEKSKTWVVPHHRVDDLERLLDDLGLDEAPAHQVGKAPSKDASSPPQIGAWVSAIPHLNDFTLDDVMGGRVPGVKWDPTLTRGVAAHMRDRDNMTVGPSAFTERGEPDTLLFTHEAGHRVGAAILAADSGRFPEELLPFRSGGEGARTRFDNPFGVSELPEEMLADAYSALLHGQLVPNYRVGLDGPDDPEARAEYLREFKVNKRTILLRRVRDMAKQLGMPSEQLYRFDPKVMNGRRVPQS